MESQIALTFETIKKISDESHRLYHVKYSIVADETGLSSLFSEKFMLSKSTGSNAVYSRSPDKKTGRFI